MSILPQIVENVKSPPFPDYSDQSLTTRSPETGFLTSVTQALHLAQPHCASITKHGNHI